MTNVYYCIRELNRYSATVIPQHVWRAGGERVTYSDAGAVPAGLPHDWLQAALKADLAEFARSAGDPAKSITTRDPANAALLNLMIGGDRRGPKPGWT